MKRSARLVVRLQPIERRALRVAAQADGSTLSAFVREALLKALAQRVTVVVPQNADDAIRGFLGREPRNALEKSRTLKILNDAV